MDRAQIFRGVFVGCFPCSRVEFLLQADDFRWGIPPTQPEYRLKRYIAFDPTIGSRSNV
jgi:hypothetical protein